MKRLITYKEPTANAKKLGWSRIKKVEFDNYTEYYYTSSKDSFLYSEVLYRTVWNNKK